MVKAFGSLNKLARLWLSNTPIGTHAASNMTASYNFNYTKSPFNFAVSRANSSADPLFSTMGQRFIFKVSVKQLSEPCAFFALPIRLCCRACTARTYVLPLLCAPGTCKGAK